MLDQLDRDARLSLETRMVRDPELAAVVRDFEPAVVHGTRTLGSMNRGLSSSTLEPGDFGKSDHPNFFITLENEGGDAIPAKSGGEVVLGRDSIQDALRGRDV